MSIDIYATSTHSPRPDGPASSPVGPGRHRLEVVPTCGAGFHCITASLGLNSSRRFAQAPCSLASALMQSASYPRSPSCIAPRRRRPLSYRCGDRRRGGCLSTIPGWSRATRRSAVVRRVPAARAEGSAATREKKHSPGSCKGVEIWRTRRDPDIRPLPLGRRRSS